MLQVKVAKEMCHWVLTYIIKKILPQVGVNLWKNKHLY